MAASRSRTTTVSSITSPSMAMRCVLLWAGAPDIDGSVPWSVPDFAGPQIANLRAGPRDLPLADSRWQVTNFGSMDPGGEPQAAGFSVLETMARGLPLLWPGRG